MFCCELVVCLPLDSISSKFYSVCKVFFFFSKSRIVLSISDKEIFDAHDFSTLSESIDLALDLIPICISLLRESSSNAASS